VLPFLTCRGGGSPLDGAPVLSIQADIPARPAVSYDDGSATASAADLSIISLSARDEIDN
jgi:hypothetical protein